jgi:hypothetical protein
MMGMAFMHTAKAIDHDRKCSEDTKCKTHIQESMDLSISLERRLSS